METITADDFLREAPAQELTKKQRIAFKMNSAFDGSVLPTTSTSLVELEHANEVSLASLLKDMNETELDFLRKCLTIDGTQRYTVEQLLNHEYFTQEFKDEFEGDFRVCV